MIVCAAANPSVDRLFEVERLSDGEIHRPAAFLQLAGGKGLNVARAVTCLGQPVRAVALVGGHAGHFVAEGLRSEGIAASFAWCDGETRSSLTVLDRSSGRLTEFYEQRAAIPSTAWGAFEDVVESALPSAAWLTLSGSLPPAAPADGYARLIRRSHAAGVPVALDSRGEAMAAALATAPDVIKVNLAEAAETLGHAVEPNDAPAAAAALASACPTPPSLVVVTLGAEGAVALDRDGTAWRGRSDGGGAYSVGSGDAFLAGLVVALERGQSGPRALALALAAGAANAELPGPGRLDQRRAERLAEGAEVRV